MNNISTKFVLTTTNLKSLLFFKIERHDQLTSKRRQTNIKIARKHEAIWGKMLEANI